MRATQIITCMGGVLIVEAGDDRCWHSEEVSECEVEVESETCCDICDEPLPEDQETKDG